MSNRTVLWRWAKPSKVFEPEENPHWTRSNIGFRSHNKVVYAGLNPIDWSWLKGEGEVLHKIVLNREQAEICVVAEAEFRLTNDEFDEFIEKEGIGLIGSYWVYEEKHYEKSFVPLLKYKGGYNLPEVLIPFSVKAEVVSWARILLLFYKFKKWIKF